jgi:hypothetical protein
VAAATDCHQHVVFTPKLHGLLNVGYSRATRHQGRVSVDISVPNTAGALVNGILSSDQIPPKYATQGG